MNRTATSLALTALLEFAVLAAVDTALAADASRGRTVVVDVAAACNLRGSNEAGRSPRSCSAERTPPVVRARDGAPSAEALRQTNPTLGGVDLRLSKLTICLVPKSGSLDGRLSDWLRSLAVGRPALGRISLQVLFCSWQA